MRILFLIILMIFICFKTQLAQGEQSYLYDQRAKISVDGEAVVNVKPDKIIITFGIETSDKNILIAKQKNNEILKKAVEAIRKAGVPDKEIQTDHISIEPRWKNSYDLEEFIGYFVRNTFVVTINDIEKVENLVTAILEAGVTNMHGIDFQTTELKKYREQAREMALKAAKEKAQKMALVLGQSVGDPVLINENYGGSPWRYYSSWGGWGYGRSSGISQNVMQNVGGNSGEITESIALGKISIRTSVSVTFELTK